MGLGLAEVAPPAGHAAVGQLFVALAEPRAGVGVRHIEHTALPYPYGNLAGIAGGVAAEHTGIVHHSEIVDGLAVLEHEGLGDSHHVHPLGLEVAEHTGGVGPLLRLPGQAPHILLFAVPVEVEHHPVNGIAGGLQRVDYPKGLGLGAVAVLRCDIGQRPERRQLLAPGKRRKLAGHSGKPFGRVYIIIGRLGRSLGGITKRVAGYHLGGGDIVEQHRIPLRIHQQRHRDIHPADASVTLHIAVVLRVVHLERIPLEVEAVTAFTAAIHMRRTAGQPQRQCVTSGGILAAATAVGDAAATAAADGEGAGRGVHAHLHPGGSDNRVGRGRAGEIPLGCDRYPRLKATSGGSHAYDIVGQSRRCHFCAVRPGELYCRGRCRGSRQRHPEAEQHGCIYLFHFGNRM